MADKFIRDYLLLCNTWADNPNDQKTQLTLEIKMPFTLDFNVTRQNLSSLNTAQFTVYNLNESFRNYLYHDPMDTTTFRPLEFFAGYQYGDERFTASCFKGCFKECYSIREGGTWKTIIEAWDGGPAIDAFISKTWAPGTEKEQVVRDLIKLSPNLDVGAIGNFLTGSYERGYTVSGNQIDALSTATANNFYIDSQCGWVLDYNEGIQGEYNEITDRTGILSSPRRSGIKLEMSLIFEPRIIVGQFIQLNSKQTKIYNGLYKVVGVAHSGTISQVVGGNMQTNLTLQNISIQQLIQKNIRG